MSPLNRMDIKEINIKNANFQNKKFKVQNILENYYHTFTKHVQRPH